jgi:hypothetical protein
MKKTIHIDDGLADRYSRFVGRLTQNEIECLGIACHLTEDTPAETMEEKLACAMNDCLDLQAVTPAVIEEAKQRGLFQ